MKKTKISVFILILLIVSAGSYLFLTKEDYIYLPEPEDLIIVDIDTYGYDIPKSKDEGSLDVTIRIKTGRVERKSLGKIKVQGSSTAKWPKKNWSLSFFKDRSREKEVDLKIGDSIVSDKWIAKAEWIDPSLLRNGLAYRLWGTMVESRKESPKYEVEKSGAKPTDAQGFPAIYPAQIMMNGEHYGLAMLTLGHDYRNFNIDKDNPKHVYMEFDARGGYTLTKTWEKFTSSGIGEWIDGYYPRNEDLTIEQIEAIETLGRFLNAPVDEFKESFDEYLDRVNMIDMLLFLEMIYDYDAVAQDVELFTHDLKKWYMLPWDKDTTFGMDWNMKGIIAGSESKILINYEEEDEEQKPWHKTYYCFKDQVEARYSQLREENVFTSENIYELARGIIEKIPQEVWDLEEQKWKEHERLPVDHVGIDQIVDWFEKRLEVLDEHFNHQSPSPNR